MKPTTFQNKVVLITGASSGIGEAVSLQLASEGACVSLAARNAERLQGIAQECNQLGGSAIAIPLDVADQQQCQNIIKKTVEKIGRIDMMVNNAV